MKKRALITLITVMLAATAFFSGCGSKSEETGAKDGAIKCKIGYWGGTCEAPIYIAYEKGYFKECGIDPELLVINTDTTTLMSNGQLDCYELTPDQFMPIKNGTEVKIIDSLHTGCIQGAAAKKSGIKSVADLEGKTIAAEVGNITQILTASEMVKAGKDPEKVKWVNYPNTEAQLAMEKGEIDGFVSYDPHAEIAVQDGHTKFFSNTFDKGINEVLCCFVGLNSKVNEENPELAGRLSKAFKMACDYLQEHPKEAAELIMEKEYIAGDAALNAKLIKDYTWVAGDSDLIHDSAVEIWNQIYRAGALKDEVSKSEIDQWAEDMVKKMVVYPKEDQSEDKQ